MKKIILILCVLTALALCAGCDKKTYTALDYFPFTENMYYEYEGVGFEMANLQTFSGYVRDNRLQRRNTVSIFYPAQMEIFEYKNGAITIIRTDISVYYPEDATQLPPTMDVPIITEPFETGREWLDRNGGRYKITSLNKRVRVPYGTFETLEITYEYKDSTRQIMERNNYAPGVGLVESAYSIDNGPWIVSQLTSVTKNHSAEIPVDVYYPDPDGGDIYAEEASININTNGDVFAEIARILTRPSDEGALAPILSKGKLNDIYIRRSDAGDNHIIVDVSADVYGINDSELNERNWLFALANTVGEIYGVNLAAVYVDGASYAGPFVQFEADDFIVVGLSFEDEE